MCMALSPHRQLQWFPWHALSLLLVDDFDVVLRPGDVALKLQHFVISSGRRKV